MQWYSMDKKLVERPAPAPAGEESALVALTDEEWADEAFYNLPHRKKVCELCAHLSGVNIQLFPACALGTLLVLQKGNQNGTPRPVSFYFTATRFYLIGERAVTDRLIGRANRQALPAGAAPCDLLGVFINTLIDEDVLFFRGLEPSLEKIEQAVQQRPEGALLDRLNYLRKQLRAYKALYGQLSNMSLAVQANPYGLFSPAQMEEYRHLGVRATLMTEHIRDLTEYAAQIRELYQAQLDMKQTRAMNILTIVSSIFLPLTLITGWYGMNFMHMSELKWAFSYPAVFLLSVGIVVAEILLFWKKGLFK